MELEYSWDINWVKTIEESSEIVSSVFWDMEAKYEEFSFKTHGVIKLTPKEKSTFIPFDELTKEQIIIWVKESISDEEITAIQNRAMKQIEFDVRRKQISNSRKTILK